MNYLNYQKHSEAEVINAVRVIKEHCAYYHSGRSPFHETEYKGGPNCNYCVLGKKEKKHTVQGEKTTYTVIDEPASCMLKDNYHQCIPWFWQVPEIKDITLF